MARPRKYDYDLWFSGGFYRLVQGVDFDVPLRTMQTNILAAARDRELLVHTKVREAPPESGEPSYVVCYRQLITRYDWPQLMDGRPHLVFEDDLKTTNLDGFIRSARSAARSRGFKVTIEKKKVPAAVRIQALPDLQTPPDYQTPR